MQEHKLQCIKPLQRTIMSDAGMNGTSLNPTLTHPLVVPCTVIVNVLDAASIVQHTRVLFVMLTYLGGLEITWFSMAIVALDGPVLPPVDPPVLPPTEPKNVTAPDPVATCLLY